ncbi:MAG: hypothetical protein ABSH20_17660 [Tepidisphaeraceae bacterium]|jgi:hypothetical protein
MSRSKHETPSRGEVTQDVSERQREYQELDEAVTIHADDTQILREIKESLNRDITIDALDVVDETMDGAEQTSEAEFTEDADKLGELHEQGREQEEDLLERHDAAKEDLEKTDQAQEKLDSGGVIAEMRRAVEELLRDLEFLATQEQTAQEAREASDQILKQQQQRMGKGGVA